ncbi:MAG: hypothetical protein Nk1A_7370 [Endomicrobiia bacterium]|nr:MAG: hypothetical protein Nk1A_7370 [Endomicrobiia bacterium]
MKKIRFSMFSFLFAVGVIFVCSSTQVVYAKCTREVVKGQVVKNEVISAGETQIVWNGGRTENVTVNAGGRQMVYVGGKSIGTTINASGFQYVGKGGSTEGTIVKEKGLQLVRGVSFDTKVSGGVQVVTGIILDSKIEKGGMQLIDWTASNHGTTVIDDGIQHIDLEASGTDKKIKLNKNGIQNIYNASPSTSEHKMRDTIEIGR